MVNVSSMLLLYPSRCSACASPFGDSSDFAPDDTQLFYPEIMCACKTDDRRAGGSGMAPGELADRGHIIPRPLEMARQPAGPN